jgi:hypothetical protein
MIPSGAVIPDPTMSVSYPLASLFGPNAVLAVFALLVTFAVLVAGLISEIRAQATFRRMLAQRGPDGMNGHESTIEVTAVPPHAA